MGLNIETDETGRITSAELTSGAGHNPAPTLNTVAVTVIPQLRINGTSKATLMLDYMEALDGLNTALKALQKTAPHMRDYLHGANPLANYTNAMGQHNARWAAIHTVFREMSTIAEAVSAQQVKA